MTTKKYFVPRINLSATYLILCLISCLIAQEIDTIFVTATRVETSIFALPLSSVLISRNTIRTKSIGDVASALDGSAGIDVRNYSLLSGASSISLLGSTSQQVLVLLDGSPINSPSLGIPDLGLIPIHILDRIEIVKGPTSSLYGANALGGVVNLISESPFDILKSPSYDIGLGYGSYHTSKLNFSIKDKIKNYHFILDNYQLKTKGLRTNEHALTQGAGFVSGYAFTPANKLRLDFRYESKEIGVPGPKPTLSQNPLYGDSTATSRYDRQSDTLYLIKTSGIWQIKPNWDVNFNSHYATNHTNFLWVNQRRFDSLLLYRDRYNSKTSIGNIISRYKFSQERSIAFGVDLAHDNFSAHTTDTSWNPSLDKIGIFSEGSVGFAKIIRAFGSLRFDHNSGFGNFVSPGLGITSNIITSLKLRLHIGRAFRAPTLNDLYWPLYGNPQIKPEIGDACQIGFDFIPNSNLSLSSTIFARKTKNLISWSPDTSGFWRPGNIDSTSISGIELTGKIKLQQGISFQCSGTIQNAYQIRKEIIYDDWLSGITEFEWTKRKQANIPSITFSSSLNIENNLGTKINIHSRYVGIRYNYYPSYNYDSLPKVIVTMQTKELPSHFILSLHINQKLYKILNLSLKLDNILNTQYAEQFGNSIKDLDYPRPGRSIFVGVNINK